MMLSSLTRISPLADTGFTVEPLPRAEWATGDYVVAEVTDLHPAGPVEVASGRLVRMTQGDRVMGALGSRFATIEATGTWQDVGDDGRIHLLTAGGILGRLRSLSTMAPSPTAMVYRGHVVSDGRKRTMKEFAGAAGDPAAFRVPVVLLIGTSMSAGKTTAAKAVIRVLKKRGLRVLGAKVTGAGRYRDILGMQDAGADAILDFVDAGLPSTHCPEAEFAPAMDLMLGRMAEIDVDIAVIEAGASPLEPYNGAHAVERLDARRCFTVLCASDPYAVVGALEAYGLKPDLVTGPTANTEAGVALVDRLTGLPVLDLMKGDQIPRLEAMLDSVLGGLSG